MKFLIKQYFFLLGCICMVLFNSCNKEFLNAKPKSDLIIPSTLSDLQGLLDDEGTINYAPALGEVSSDDYYMDYESYQSLFYNWTRKVYVWAPEVFGGIGNIQDWNMVYKEILYANVVLEQLNKITRTADNASSWDNIKGGALFIRGLAFFNIAKEFAPMYDISKANSELGIPLRLSSNITNQSTRASLQETYDQILSDINQSKELLSSSFPYSNRNRPSKEAAMALLARIYLSVGDYGNAGLYSDSALQFYNILLDYNTLDTTSANPFTIDNEEVIYEISMIDSGPTIYVTFSQGYSIDSTLYNSYSFNDLRRSLYFNMNGNYINFKGAYNYNGLASNSLTTDELYLIKSECEARDGNIITAMDDLNDLLIKRWKTGTFIPYKASTPKEALDIILKERRKELVMRGIRWSDLKRLNKENFNIVLKRVLGNETYTLSPNDPRYVLPIPPDIIELSGIQQNER